MDPLTSRAASAVAATRTVLVPDVLDASGASFWLHCSLPYVRSLLRSGRLAGRRVGRRWLITRTALLAFVNEAQGRLDSSAPPLRVISGQQGDALTGPTETRPSLPSNKGDDADA